MMFSKKTIRDIDVKGKRVLVRVDFNVPIKDGVVGDDTRIRGAIPTLEALIKACADLIMCSQLGRPKDGTDPKYSMKPVAAYLGKLMKKDVAFAEDCIGPKAEAAAKALKPGDVLLLENTRFHPEEEKNDPGMAKQLAALADIYVNDAFGSAHRAHASTEGVAKFLPAVAGLLMEKEIQYLGAAGGEPAQACRSHLGGAQNRRKTCVVQNPLSKAPTDL